MPKATKIVATIGPATESEEQIEKLILAGMNVARFNTKHADPSWHNTVIQRVKAVAERLNQPIATLLDLQGPEVRIDLPNNQPFEVKKGQTVTFTSLTNKTGDHLIFIPANVVNSIQVHNQIMLEDGACEFTVTAKDTQSFLAIAELDCVVKPRKTMNTPKVVLQMPSLTERDFAYLDTIHPDLVDFVGLSFVRNKVDIDILRQELSQRHFQSHIVAKIENQQALDHLDEICQVSDAIMVARGDLGVEVPFQELSYWQKKIITKCRVLAKPVITATEMLKSMVEHPRPTRAEVSDVANAIYDGTDAIMLSEETTVGKYPIKAVETQATIAEFNEKHAECDGIVTHDKTVTAAVARATIDIVSMNELGISKIVCLTESGQTAQELARFRPKVPIYGLTPDVKTWRKLNLVYGVKPVLLSHVPVEHLTEELLLLELKSLQITSTGEKILLVRGKFWRRSGFTNTVSVITTP